MADYVPSVPSAHSALALLEGKPQSGAMVARDLLGRAAIIWLGIQAVRVTGQKPPRDSILYAFFGALAIEAFILLHIYKDRQNVK